MLQNQEGRHALITHLFVDSDHAGDILIRRSRTGFIIYLNNAPVIWYSKRQETVETSVFGAEFVAMKVGFEACRGLRYKLRMMGAVWLSHLIVTVIPCQLSRIPRIQNQL
jgi:hypothetical protein